MSLYRSGPRFCSVCPSVFRRLFKTILHDHFEIVNTAYRLLLLNFELHGRGRHVENSTIFVNIECSDWNGAHQHKINFSYPDSILILSEALHYALENIAIHTIILEILTSNNRLFQLTVFLIFIEQRARKYVQFSQYQYQNILKISSIKIKYRHFNSIITQQIYKSGNKKQWNTMMDEQNNYTKVQVKMTTNVTPKEKVRTFLIYPEIPLNKYIELYQQTFDIDLYAYRVSFQHQKQIISKLAQIPDLRKRSAEKDIEVEILVESVGG